MEFVLRKDFMQELGGERNGGKERWTNTSYCYPAKIFIASADQDGVEEVEETVEQGGERWDLLLPGGSDFCAFTEGGTLLPFASLRKDVQIDMKSKLELSPTPLRFSKSKHQKIERL